MELTQNNVLTVDRKPGSANRLAPLSAVYTTVNTFGVRGKCWVL